MRLGKKTPLDNKSCHFSYHEGRKGVLKDRAIINIRRLLPLWEIVGKLGKKRWWTNHITVYLRNDTLEIRRKMEKTFQNIQRDLPLLIYCKQGCKIPLTISKILHFPRLALKIPNWNPYCSCLLDLAQLQGGSTTWLINRLIVLQFMNCNFIFIYLKYLLSLPMNSNFEAVYC